MHNFLLKAPWENYTDNIAPGVRFVNSISGLMDEREANRIAGAMGATVIPLVEYCKEQGLKVDEAKAAFMATLPECEALKFIPEIESRDVLEGLAGDVERPVLATEARNKLEQMGEDIAAELVKEPVTPVVKPPVAPAVTPKAEPKTATKAPAKAAAKPSTPKQ